MKGYRMKTRCCTYVVSSQDADYFTAAVQLDKESLVKILLEFWLCWRHGARV
jgi:hypothetical protein